jgi:hypothetical protein
MDWACKGARSRDQVSGRQGGTLCGLDGFDRFDGLDGFDGFHRFDRFGWRRVLHR